MPPPRRISRNIPARHRAAAREVLERAQETERDLVLALDGGDLEAGFRILCEEVVLLRGLVTLLVSEDPPEDLFELPPRPTVAPDASTETH